MAVHRFRIASNKKTELLQRSMREIAVLLSKTPPKEEKARIKVEALIREHYLIEAYGILSQTCTVLSERIKLISSNKSCPPDLASSIATLLYAEPHVDIPELVEIGKQFRLKYGKKFENDATRNAGGIVNERVISRLSIHRPPADLIQTYLQTCCMKFGVKWDPFIPATANIVVKPMPSPVRRPDISPGTGSRSGVKAKPTPTDSPASPGMGPNTSEGGTETKGGITEEDGSHGIKEPLLTSSTLGQPEEPEIYILPESDIRVPASPKPRGRNTVPFEDERSRCFPYASPKPRGPNTVPFDEEPPLFFPSPVRGGMPPSAPTAASMMDPCYEGDKDDYDEDDDEDDDYDDDDDDSDDNADRGSQEGSGNRPPGVDRSQKTVFPSRTDKTTGIQDLVEDASDSDMEDEFDNSSQPNRHPSPGGWMEPAEFNDTNRPQQ